MRPQRQVASAQRAAGQRPAQGAAAGQRPAQGAAAGQRPAQGAAAAARPAAGTRPTAGQVGNFLDVPGTAGGGGKAVAAGAVAGAGRAGGAAGDFLQNGAAAPLAVAGAASGRARGDAGRPGTAGENLAQNRPERIENRGERQGTRDQRRDEVRNQYEQNNPGSFWENNPGWAAWAVTRPMAWASWGAVGSWGGYGTTPTSYNYGENVYYADDQVYADNQPVATAEEYAEQAATIANSAPSETPGKGDWLPLGVFALTQDGQASGAEPSLYMQLALSKQGVISGTLQNTLTGKAQPLEGMVDKKSQRVAWSVVDQQRPIVETGLENLTQDSSPALVHFADGGTQQWLMVRMPEPKQ